MQKDKQTLRALIMSYSILGAFTIISLLGPILLGREKRTHK